MAWNKKAESKHIVADLMKAGMAISFTLLLAACGDDSDNSSKAADNDEGREVATLVDMGRCTNDREGDTVYVAEKLTDYLCKNGSWVDVAEAGDIGGNPKSNSSTDIPGSSFGVIPSDSEESSSSFNKDDYTDDNLVVKKRSILGVAQKGPFKFGSPVYLRELSEEGLNLTGMAYEDEVSSNKGDFVIPNVNLISPYASVEVRGLYRNEIMGEYSKDSISLFALTDLKTAVTDSKDDERNKVNVNLLTHLEYNRAIYLVHKGYSVYAAKKQADQEIMTAFELPTTVKYSEDLSVFEDSEDDNVDYANASLMMLNLLFLGNRTDAEIKTAIDKFVADIEKDGSWDDDSTKAVMADFANEVDVDEIRANVKAWNILNIPMFETQLEMFWNNVYGLGGCSDKRKGVVAQNTNKLSKNYVKYFICNGSLSTYNWRLATAFEKDTYEWSDGKEGELKKGNVTDTIYVYNGSKWEVSEMETSIGLCKKNNTGVVSEFKEVYYICRDNAWVEAMELEYDTYGLKGVEGDVKPGVVNEDKHYVYEDGAWRASASAIEDSLGACVTSREGEKYSLNDKYYACESKEWTQIKAEEFGLGYCSTANEGSVNKLNDVYYICKSNAWTTATTLEYDTYGLTGAEGDVKAGKVNTSNYYIYKNGKWQTATSVEKDLGGCIASREGEVGKSGSTYYICKSKSWTTATTLEYDTYGENCTSAEVGEIINGKVIATNKYYCLANGWVSLMGGWSWDCPKEARLNPEIEYGEMTDTRDGQVYKTVVIGEGANAQTWMAENLNFNYNKGTAKSFCYDNKEANCAVTGRLYTWAAAMDSVTTGCGYGKKCSASGTIQGVCPDGWHLPSKAEWETLSTNVGGRRTAGIMLKSTTGWENSVLPPTTGWENSGDGKDSYGFSAFPAGESFIDGSFSYAGSRADFWSSSKDDGDHSAYSMYLYYGSEYASLDYNNKGNGLSVRCLKNSN